MKKNSLIWSDTQLTKLLTIARSAGSEILEIYTREREFDVTYKKDDSPLTEADRRSNFAIVEELKEWTPGIPILSEEIETIPSFKMRSSWMNYWLIDPLDGTKEFISRNGEFTVNIAHISNGVPDLGVVHVPVTGTTYLGKLGVGAWKVDGNDAVTAIKVSKCPERDGVARVIASRSHRDQLVDEVIQAVGAKFDKVEVVSMGSSLKICLLAEGEADIYPRFAPTCVWDTGAAHAVLLAAGGEIFDTSFKSLRYNCKSKLINPHFIAIADSAYGWEEVLTPIMLLSTG